MSTYTPPYQLTDTILRLSTEIAATVKEITVRGNLSAQPQLHRANRIRSVHSCLLYTSNQMMTCPCSFIISKSKRENIVTSIAF